MAARVVRPCARRFAFAWEEISGSFFAAAGFVSVVKEQSRTDALGPFVLFGDQGDTVVFLDHKAKGAGRSYV